MAARAVAIPAAFKSVAKIWIGTSLPSASAHSTNVIATE
jgi:hypothetical protein